jgi:hypothetical protein
MQHCCNVISAENVLVISCTLVSVRVYTNMSSGRENHQVIHHQAKQSLAMDQADTSFSQRCEEVASHKATR